MARVICLTFFVLRFTSGVFCFSKLIFRFTFLMFRFTSRGLPYPFRGVPYRHLGVPYRHLGIPYRHFSVPFHLRGDLFHLFGLPFHLRERMAGLGKAFRRLTRSGLRTENSALHRACRCLSIQHQIRHIGQKAEYHDDAFPTRDHLLLEEPSEDEQQHAGAEHNGIVEKRNALYTQWVNGGADAQYQKDIEQVRTDYVPDRHLRVLLPCRHDRGG